MSRRFIKRHEKDEKSAHQRKKTTKNQKQNNSE